LTAMIRLVLLIIVSSMPRAINTFWVNKCWPTVAQDHLRESCEGHSPSADTCAIFISRHITQELSMQTLPFTNGWPWASHLASPCSRLLICRLGIITEPTPHM
jgi:hypothetical protein